jgi:hypothetical protein
VRVLSIFVRTGTTKYASAEQELCDLFRTQLPDVEHDRIVVDTDLPRCEIERSPGRVVIGGDNSAREFSAFDSGVAFAGEALWSYDLVNLATAAFRQMYWDYLERFGPKVLTAVAGEPACLGHIDCYNEPIRVLGCTSQHWLRSCCVFIPPVELKLLGSLVSTRGDEGWFSGDPAEPFRADAPLSDTYRRFISDWLLGKDIGQGVTWHSGFALDATTLPQFEQKTLAILNEHLLGIRLRAAGCRTIDVTWLSSVLSRGDAVDWRAPWWRQLAERDRHALHVNMEALAAS